MVTERCCAAVTWAARRSRHSSVLARRGRQVHSRHRRNTTRLGRFSASQAMRPHRRGKRRAPRRLQSEAPAPAWPSRHRRGSLRPSSKRTGVEPLKKGQVVLETKWSQRTKVSQILGELGLNWQIIRNRDDAIIAPPDVSKATGLAAALGRLGLSPASRGRWRWRERRTAALCLRLGCGSGQRRPLSQGQGRSRDALRLRQRRLRANRSAAFR